MVGLVFDDAFEQNFRKNKQTTLHVLLDATAASQAFTALSYLQNIAINFTGRTFPVELVTHKLFNENADNHTFMALTELLSITTLLSVILTAVVFVKEKEEGTWDIMLLMPVNAKIIILAKSFSQVIIVMVGIVISVGFVIFGVFNTPIHGSFLAFILLSFLYAFTGAGIGLFIAAIAKDVMQVAQLSIVIMLPLIFLSGAWTPIYAMIRGCRRFRLSLHAALLHRRNGEYFLSWNAYFRALSVLFRGNGRGKRALFYWI